MRMTDEDDDATEEENATFFVLERTMRERRRRNESQLFAKRQFSSFAEAPTIGFSAGIEDMAFEGLI